MFPYCMPFLIVNLGGEMLYILQQRLKAQKISGEKSKRVLEEVTSSMLKRSFVKELCKPQPIYSTISTKEVFDRLAHSSIMKLSSNSMSKLYDLMCMGLKYQILLCFNPKELIQVTYTHLDLMSQILTKSKSVEMIKKKFHEIVNSMEYEDFFHLKEELLLFFKDKNVKVGVFLAKDFQNRTGYFSLERPVSEFYHHHEKPLGTIKTFDEFGEGVVSENTFEHPWEKISQLDVDYISHEKRPSPLGQTLYIKPEDGKGKGGKSKRNKGKGKLKVERAEKEVRGKEFNFLASMLGGVTDQSEEESEEAFDLVFFEEAEISSDEEEEKDNNPFASGRRDQVIVVEGKGSTDGLASDFDIKGKEDNENNDDDDDGDLLSLLDGM